MDQAAFIGPDPHGNDIPHNQRGGQDDDLLARQDVPENDPPYGNGSSGNTAPHTRPFPDDNPALSGQTAPQAAVNPCKTAGLYIA